MTNERHDEFMLRKMREEALKTKMLKAKKNDLGYISERRPA